MAEFKNNLKERVASELNRALDVNKIIVILLSRWYFIIGSIIVCLLVANITLRYSKPIYRASLTMKLEDEKPNQLSDFFRFTKTTGKLENFLKTESEIIRSRSLGIKALQKLNYRITYSTKGNIISSELYPNNIFNISYIQLDSSTIGKSYLIRFKTPETFELGIDDETRATFRVGDTVFFERSFLVVNALSPKLRSYVGIPITFRANNYITLSSFFASNLMIEIEKGTSIVDMTFSWENDQLAADYLNTLTNVYIEESVNNKSQAAQQTITFIDEQLIDLSNKVRLSQSDMTNFKTRNKGVELEDIGQRELEQLTKQETENNILQLKMKMLVQLEQSVRNTKGKTLDYMTFDDEDLQTLPNLFALLNTLLLEKIALTNKSTANSPVVIENQKKLTEIKASILRSLASQKEKLTERIEYNNRLAEETKKELLQLPGKQQDFINIKREFNVNEKVYSYLLEKKLETSISKSSIVPNATVIDNALVQGTPIFPNRTRTYNFAILIGLGLGTLLLFIIRMLYQKIPDKETIESLSVTPVIGVIKRISTDVENANYDVYVFRGPKSVFTESIRGIRTNINFLLKGEKHRGICVTSTVSGEGKTFCVINIAASLTMLGNRVIIVGCDLRRPRIHLSFKGMTNDIGLSTYLVGRNTIEDVTHATEFPKLFVLPAGPAPPNPAELLQTSRMEELIANLKKEFDYVLFDTAPVGLVSDSFSIMKSADLNLFILRAQYSKRDFAMVPDSLRVDNEINNLYTILNAYESSSVTYSSIYKTDRGGYGGYGYYYYGGYGSSGYGYYGKSIQSSYYAGYYSEEDEKSPWWMFWTKARKKKKKEMSSKDTLAIIGLGYVGLPLAVEFGKQYSTIGFDINAQRIKELNQGNDRTLEVDKESLSAAGLLSFSSNPEDLQKANIFIVTVPTPIDKNKRPDLRPLLKASETVGRVLKKGDIVVYESTVYPGCTEHDCVPVLEKASGLVFNADFFCGYSPERINPGDKVHTVTRILKITSGSNAETADRVNSLYASIITAGTYKAPSIRVAEAAKVIENCQRDINIAFVNELALIFDRMGIDTLEVLDAAATKWNFLPFRPGLVGGHCIGVDPYYLTHKAEEIGYHSQVILAGRKINDNMGSFIANKVVKLMIKKGTQVNNARALVLGLTFKENCPDIRNSKVVDIISELHEFGVDVEAYDPLANADEVKHEYGIRLVEAPSGKYDAIVLAVSHSQFEDLDIRALGNDKSVLYDVKSVLAKSMIDARL